MRWAACRQVRRARGCSGGSPSDASRYGAGRSNSQGSRVVAARRRAVLAGGERHGLKRDVVRSRPRWRDIGVVLATAWGKAASSCCVRRRLATRLAALVAEPVGEEQQLTALAPVKAPEHFVHQLRARGAAPRPPRRRCRYPPARGRRRRHRSCLRPAARDAAGLLVRTPRAAPPCTATSTPRGGRGRCPGAPATAPTPTPTPAGAGRGATSIGPARG
jgi:hypothetical protein